MCSSWETTARLCAIVRSAPALWSFQRMQPTTAQFKFASISVQDESVDRVLSAVSHQVIDRIGEHVDLALVFPSTHFVKHAAELGLKLRGVIGPEHEIENEPAVAIIAAQLPGVGVHPFHIDGRDALELARTPARFSEFVKP